MRPIHRIKHVVDLEGTANETQSNSSIITAVDAPVLAQPAEVETGSTVNAFFASVEVIHVSGTARPNVYLIFMKNPGNQMTIPEANAVGVNDAKKFVIHQEMIMVGDLVENMPRILYKGVIVIPKGYRRFGPDDRLYMGIRTGNTNTVDWCAQIHFKEFK